MVFQPLNFRGQSFLPGLVKVAKVCKGFAGIDFDEIILRATGVDLLFDQGGSGGPDFKGLSGQVCFDRDTVRVHQLVEDSGRPGGMTVAV